MENPSINSTRNVAISDTGTVTAGTSVARTLPRNRKITDTTIAMAMASVL